MEDNSLIKALDIAPSTFYRWQRDGVSNRIGYKELQDIYLEDEEKFFELMERIDELDWSAAGFCSTIKKLGGFKQVGEEIGVKRQTLYQATQLKKIPIGTKYCIYNLLQEKRNGL